MLTSTYIAQVIKVMYEVAGPELRRGGVWRLRQDMWDKTHGLLEIISPDDTIAQVGTAHGYLEDIIGAPFVHTKVRGACALRAISKLTSP